MLQVLLVVVLLTVQIRPPLSVATFRMQCFSIVVQVESIVGVVGEMYAPCPVRTDGSLFIHSFILLSVTLFLSFFLFLLSCGSMLLL
jgi:hypothetical protein